MFIQNRKTHDLIVILTIEELYDPYTSKVSGRFQHGEEEQDSEYFDKTDLIFPSGEELPACWVDPHYRQHAA